MAEHEVGLARRVLNRDWQNVNGISGIFRAAQLIHEATANPNHDIRLAIASSVPVLVALITASKMDGVKKIGNKVLDGTCCDGGFSSHLPNGIATP